MKLDYIHLGDCLQWLKTVPDQSVDIIWTDPPYGNNQNKGDLNASLKTMGKRKSTPKTILNDDPESWEPLIKGLIAEGKRILKPTSALCCCCGGGGGKNVGFAKMAMWLDDEMQFDHAVIWNKGGLGLGWRYRRNYEFVMIAHPRRGKMKWEAEFCDKRTANVVDISRVPPRKEGHPTPKPVELVKHFLALHGKKGDVVCDPFAGAGTTCVAAKSLGMRYIACELDPHWHGVAEQRIAEMDGEPVKQTKVRPLRVTAKQRRERERKIPGPNRAATPRRRQARVRA